MQEFQAKLLANIVSADSEIKAGEIVTGDVALRCVELGMAVPVVHRSYETAAVDVGPTRKRKSVNGLG